MAYDDLDQAVDIANDTEYGLSAVVSGDPAKAAEVAPKLRAGMVAVNAWGPGPGAAFGGYKASGNGREGGCSGPKDLSELRRSGGVPAKRTHPIPFRVGNRDCPASQKELRVGTESVRPC